MLSKSGTSFSAMNNPTSSHRIASANGKTMPSANYNEDASGIQHLQQSRIPWSPSQRAQAKDCSLHVFVDHSYRRKTSLGNKQRWILEYQEGSNGIEFCAEEHMKG
ncbi:hypothetical protein HAX54_033311 [Datura stramonium]|uniref:Uncharacterized protein n=1 Tax=Datura stramonium TaxID=4076 RepID=A0ABS8SDA6_DATST|nr:hypothetical protein [Datura stramonium]